MYSVVIKFHIFISSCFFLTGAVLVAWSITGWARNRPGRLVLYNRLSYLFIALLYVQLVTGLTMYFFLKPDPSASITTLEEAMEKSTLRFWAIEHVSLMIFALLLSQIGRLFIRQLPAERRMFRAATFYYGFSFLLVLASAAMALFR